MKRELFDKVKEIEINGSIYRVSLQEGECDCINLYACPCCLPSAVFYIATICEIENSCSEFDFYQAKIFTDPEIEIISCSFKDIVERSLDIYFSNANLNTNRKNRYSLF